MHDIQISVLMPAYNTEKYIGEAIDSVLNQTFRSFELLIVNDGSTDKTEEIIRSYNDPRIILINQPNKGVSAALNTGLKVARGEYIARFDADDISYPCRLQEQYDFIDNNKEYVLIGSDADYMDVDGNFIFLYHNVAYDDKEIRNKITDYCPFIHTTVMYRKDIALELGGYDSKAHTFEDHLFWTKFIQKGKVLNTDRPLTSVRLNPESVTADDRLRGSEFNSLKREIILKGSITATEEERLVSILRSQNTLSFKQYSYYILVAKKYLWNNLQPSKARLNLTAAIKLAPFRLRQYLLFVLSYFPKAFIDLIYKMHKR